MCLFVYEFLGLFFLQDQSIRVGELKEERGIDVKESINHKRLWLNTVLASSSSANGHDLDFDGC